MLLELLKYCITPAPKYAKKMGYLSEIVATEARYKRLNKVWQPHLDRTKRAILRGVQSCKNRERVLVLGSGHLYDVPVAELSRKFDEVILVDLIHPRRARRTARFYKNVGLVQADITGVAEQLCEKPGLIPESKPEFFLREDFDYVISVNLLSQLPMIPNKWLRRNGVEDFLVQEFCKHLVEAHLQYLKKFRAKKCLITDTEFIATNLDGEVEAQESAIYDIELPELQKSWEWDIAPAPEIDKKLNFKHKVGVFHL